MAKMSFLPDLPALRTDPVGDDAGEDEGHPEHDDEVGEVLLHREGTDQLVVARVGERVGREIDQEAERDHRATRLGKPRDRQAAGERLQELCDRATGLHGRLLRLREIYH
jgi:hypothetical protein